MFDTIHAPCPSCGRRISEQTKLHHCLMEDILPGDRISDTIVSGLIEDWIVCPACKRKLLIMITDHCFDGFAVVEKAEPGAG